MVYWAPWKNIKKGGNDNMEQKAHENTSQVGLFSNMNEQDIRDICKHQIDSFEHWSRRFVDDILKANYGGDYFECMVSEDQPLVKAEIKRRIEQRVSDNPHRYPRKIDAILMEDIEYFLCRDDLYHSLFKTVLEPFYSGQKEVRGVLKRMISIRNKLSHGNTISFHEAEQCICYTNDFIEQYKIYYKKQGREKDYNVPVILRVKDCLGHDCFREDNQCTWELWFNGGAGQPDVRLRSGDEYRLWVEVDNSFDPSMYEVEWYVTIFFTTFAKGTGCEVRFSLTNKEVSETPKIHVKLTTKRDWHRFGDTDDIVEISLSEVLPPIEDTY